MATRTRQPVKPLNQDAATIRANAEAEKARKAASRAALKAAKSAAATPTPEPAPQPDTTSEESFSTQVEHALQDALHVALEHVLERGFDEHAAALAAQRVDWEALGSVGTFEAYLAEQGFESNGAPKAQDKTPYTGPMVTLKTARLNYVAAANGILCNGDKLATLCGQHSREETVRALIQALKLPNNPYSALNPGQQSMNLRNKARHALKNGFLTMAEIEAAFAA
jgi:hypothetical protein